MLILKGGRGCNWEGGGGGWGWEGSWSRCSLVVVDVVVAAGECCMETIATLVAPPPPLAAVEEVGIPEAVPGRSERRLGEVRPRNAAQAEILAAPEVDEPEGWRPGQVRVLIDEEGGGGDGHRRWTFDRSRDCDDRWSTYKANRKASRITYYL